MLRRIFRIIAASIVSIIIVTLLQQLQFLILTSYACWMIVCVKCLIIIVCSFRTCFCFITIVLWFLWLIFKFCDVIGSLMGIIDIKYLHLFINASNYIIIAACATFALLLIYHLNIILLVLLLALIQSEVTNIVA